MKKMINLAILLFAISPIFSCTHSQSEEVTSYSERKELSLLHHTIKIKIDHNVKTLSGDCEILVNGFKTNKSTELSFQLLAGKINLVLIDNIATNNYVYSDYPGLKPKQTKEYDLKLLKITIPAKIAQKNKFKIRVFYQDDDFYGTATNPEDGKPFSLGQVTSNNAFSSHINYYPYIQYQGKSADIYITTNLIGGHAITSGSLVDKIGIENGFKTFHYHTDNMSGIIPYPFSVAKYKKITEMAEDRKTPLEIYFLPGDRKFAEQRMPIIQEFFSLYTDIFGPYPFSKFAVVETDLKEGNIGLAAQSLIMVSKKVWFAKTLDKKNTGLRNAPLLVLADEINHQWNAYKVNSPNFLAEGISRYIDSFYMESLGGPKTMTEHMLQTKASYFYLIEKGKAEDKPITDPTVYPALYFIKGASAIHMLRGMLGDDIFKQSLRHYFTENEGKVTSLDHFRKSFEYHSGTELSWFFNQWFYKTGWPKMKFNWKKQDSNIEVHFEQIQKGTIFRIDRFPVEIKYVDGSKESIYFNILAKRKQLFNLNRKKKVKQILFDKQGWVLMQTVK